MKKSNSPVVDSMLEKASLVMKNAYSPYSNFLVGACLKTIDGNFFVGCNYENASFSLTKCAEANAIGTMIAAGEKNISEIVIVGSSDEPCAPCGACRQTIREFAEPNILIHMFGKNGDSMTMSLDELLPQSFGPQFLQK